MNRKIRVALVFGGRSAEHEVSLQSARNVYEAIDKTKFDVVLIGIDKTGQWLLSDSKDYLLNAGNPKLIALNKTGQGLSIVPGTDSRQVVRTTQQPTDVSIDVVFPLVHGTYGEDGTLQGMFKLMDIPFVGASVLGSSVCMDKDVMKRLLRDAGIPSAKFVTLNDHQMSEIKHDDLAKKLGSPFFLKPANAGSSVGVHKVKSGSDFPGALLDALQYDRKILCEEFVEGREIECSVLGGDEPIASIPGEVIPTHEFYSYEAKYIDEQGAKIQIPADLPQEIVQKIQRIAIEAFQATCCEGMARVDFFLKKNGDVFVNELNTIPGFTRISMYPKMWEASGISYRDLITRLIDLALERHARERKLKTSFD